METRVVAVPDDEVSRFVFGLYRDAGAIRVRRAETVTLGRIQQAHTRRVIDAWMAAARPQGDPALRMAEARVVPIRRSARLRTRLRTTWDRVLGRYRRPPAVLRPLR
jgi:hypothetical protein